MTTLRAAAEQSPEPVAYRHMMDDGWEYFDSPTGADCEDCQPLYAHPCLSQQPAAWLMTNGDGTRQILAFAPFGYEWNTAWTVTPLYTTNGKDRG